MEGTTEKKSVSLEWASAEEGCGVGTKKDSRRLIMVHEKFMILAMLLLVVSSVVVVAQETTRDLGIEDVVQPELKELPIKPDPEPGIIEGTWDWFVGLFVDVEVQDPEIVKRSIIEQDLDISDVRLVTMNITRNRTFERLAYDENSVLVGNETWQITDVVGTHQVFVTSSQTYDAPLRSTCYDAGDSFVCEDSLRCDGIVGIEYGCEMVTVSKNADSDGGIVVGEFGMPPMRDFVSRKDVITSPELIKNEEFTLFIPDVVVEEVKARMSVGEEIS